MSPGSLRAAPRGVLELTLINDDKNTPLRGPAEGGRTQFIWW